MDIKDDHCRFIVTTVNYGDLSLPARKVYIHINTVSL